MATTSKPDDVSTDFKAEMQALRDDLAAVMETVKEFGANRAAHAAESAKEAVGHVTDQLKATASEARRRGEVAANEIEDMISARPLTSVLVALGVGYILGKLRHH